MHGHGFVWEGGDQSLLETAPLGHAMPREPAMLVACQREPGTVVKGQAGIHSTLESPSVKGLRIGSASISSQLSPFW